MLLNLAAIQPFDILLTAGKGKSRMIRVADTLDRRRLGLYSHAAIFLAPTLIIESDEGVNFLDLVGWADPRRNTPMFFAPSIGSIFIELEGVTAATIMRSKRVGKREMVRQLRDDRWPLMRTVLFSEYDWQRIIGASHFLPLWAIPAVQGLIRRFYRIRNPGPICSELATSLLVEAGLTNVVPGRISPSDLAHHDDFAPVPNSIADRAALPSDAELLDPVHDLRKMLTPPMVSADNPKLSAAAWDVADILKVFDQTNSVDPKMHWQKLVTKQVDRTKAWLRISDEFWSWFVFAKHCHGTCPERKRVVHSVGAGEIDPRTGGTKPDIFGENTRRRCANFLNCDSIDAPGGTLRAILEKCDALLEDINTQVMAGLDEMREKRRESLA